MRHSTRSTNQARSHKQLEGFKRRFVDRNEFNELLVSRNALERIVLFNGSHGLVDQATGTAFFLREDVAEGSEPVRYVAKARTVEMI